MPVTAFDRHYDPGAAGMYYRLDEGVQVSTINALKLLIFSYGTYWHVSDHMFLNVLYFKDQNLTFSGYLVAGDYQHASASEFICLDERPEMTLGGAPNHDGKTFYLAEAVCGSLPCPPYVQGRELTCVVCSK